MFKEFRDFAVKGNVIDLAVGVIVGAAFGKITTSFVEDVVMPPLAIAGGLASAWIERRAIRLGKTVATLCAGLFLVGIASPIIEMMRLHPYEYVHFNRIAGGIKGAQGRFMLDYWGLAFKQAGNELRAKLESLPPPAGRHWRIATCGPHPPAHIALGQQFERARQHAGLGIGFETVTDGRGITLEREDGRHGRTPGKAGERQRAGLQGKPGC